MSNELSNEQIDLIKNNEWVIFSTADLNNNPRAIVVIPSRIEKDRIILSNIQMNKSIENIKNNNKCFINVYSKDSSDMQIKISGIANVYENGNLYTEIKEYNFLLRFNTNLSSRFFNEFKESDNIFISAREKGDSIK